jgi:2-iminobutanoate/2-iminopropanoate deaminase
MLSLSNLHGEPLHPELVEGELVEGRTMKRSSTAGATPSWFDKLTMKASRSGSQRRGDIHDRPTTLPRRNATMLTLHTLNDQIRAHSHNAAHGTEVRPNARILFCNGQVGARLDGTVPNAPAEQIEVIFERVRIILAASGMTFEDVVKFTVYVTDKSILDDYFRIRGRIMGDHNPPATLLIVKEFPRAGVDVEIETIAAKAD